MRLNNYISEAKYDKVSRGSRAEQLSWLKDEWRKINKRYFKGKLKEPTIRFQKDTGTKMKRRAAYFPLYNEMSFHPKVFNAPEEKVIWILKHETAHQAVALIDKEKGDPHRNPNFAKYCLLMNIEPHARDDEESQKLYLTPDEIKGLEKEKEIRRAEVEKRKETEAKSGKQKLFYVKDNMVVQWLSAKSNTWRKGIVISASDKQGKTWNVLTDIWASGWHKVPITLLYSVPPEEAKEFDHPEWTKAVDKIRTYIQDKKDISSMKKAFRRMW